MEWIDQLNKAIGYMEAHLIEKIDYEELAKIACCSTYHFQRMFSYIAGVSLSEYIRRRRMSMAAVDLQDEDARIIDVAQKYGYESPTDFNRAFQSIHGAAPSAVKKGGISIKTFPPITIEITIKGVVTMDYRIIKKDAFRIVGVSELLHKELEKNFEIVPKMWQKAAMDGTMAKLAALIHDEPAGLLGISVCNDEESWKYFISVASDKGSVEGFEEYIVPAATWAVFSGEGTGNAMQELEKRIVTEWLPTSGYEYGSAPDVEVFINPDPQNAKYEGWIPVIPVNK